MSFETFLTVYISATVGALVTFVFVEHKLRKLARNLLEEDRQNRLKDLTG